MYPIFPAGYNNLISQKGKTMFTIDVSEVYPSQYVLVSDDPYAVYSCGVKVTEDGTIVEGGKIIQICEALSGYGDVSLTQAALEQMRRDNDLTPFESPSFTSSKIPKMFQLKGINRSNGGDAYVYVYSTGCGKTMMGTMEICRALDTDLADIAIVVPTSSLMPQWEEFLHEDTSLDVASVHRCRSKAKRMEFYQEDHQVYIINYDKFALNDDMKAIEKMCRKKRVILVLDETHKIKHRTSNNRALKKFCNHVRPIKVIGLSATPIESSLLDWYNQMRVFAPDVYGTVRDFEQSYTVGGGAKDMFNRYLGFQNFEDCRLRSAHMVSFADKNSDPAIAAEFPESNEIILNVELSHFEQKLYREIEELGRGLGEMRNGAIFMQYLQRLCNAPETLIPPYADSNDQQGQMILERASGYLKHLEKSKESAKMSRLEALLDELMEGAGKTVVFAHYTNICLEQLNVRLARFKPLMFHGGLPQSEKSRVISQFQSDPTSRLLLLSDAGAEGFNLPQANTLIHYDTPTQYSRYQQRSGRISRIDSKFSSIDIYRFVTKGTIEERIENLMLQRKKLAEDMGFLDGEEAAFLAIDVAEMTERDYRYLLGF